MWGYRVPVCIPYPYPPVGRCCSGWVGSVLGLWYGVGMSDGRIKDILALVETWPVTAQEELAAIVQKMDAALRGVGYYPTEAEIAELLARYRSEAGDTVLIPTMIEVPRISEAERAELMASLEQARADSAAGRSHVLKPGMLRTEFEAIMQHDMNDEELDALLGITDKQPSE